MSALSGHLVFHFAKKDLPIADIRLMISDYDILPLTCDDFDWAHSNRRNDDFEDALQVSVAIRNGCEVFYTFDKDLAKAYKSNKLIKIILIKNKN
jgi:predicted nucleic acid-binding protein